MSSSSSPHRRARGSAGKWPAPIQIPGLCRCVARIASSAVMCSVSACGEPLVSPELIQNNRVLGARVEVAADPEQAWVAPGQSATLRWFVVSPSGPPALGWAVNLCVAKPVSRGLPLCALPSFVRYTRGASSMDESRLEFSMPDEPYLGSATQVTANAAFCSSGNPILGAVDADLTDVRCPDHREYPLLASMGIFVARDGKNNLNPSLASLEAVIDATPWPTWSEPSPPALGCTDLGAAMPIIKVGTSSHQIALTLPTDQSEPLTTVSSLSATDETIQLSHYVTAGELERVFSIIDFARPAPQVSVIWNAPSKIPVDGQLVRFFFVLRDGRGGVDWTSRILCVAP
jgi:hypothetical protein